MHLQLKQLSDVQERSFAMALASLPAQLFSTVTVYLQMTTDWNSPLDCPEVKSICCCPGGVSVDGAGFHTPDHNGYHHIITRLDQQ
jgi:hypothetical protein